MTLPLANKLLYMDDLARRLVEMEAGIAPMQALLYRLLARRLRAAAAGFVPAALAAQFGPFEPVIAEMLEARHFDDHGSLRGPCGPGCRAVAAGLLLRLGVHRPGPQRSPAVRCRGRER